jgi:hypothetical protein
MKKLPTVISRCPDCPFYRYNAVAAAPKCCHWQSAYAPEDNWIPEDCPLEDAEEKS